MKKATIILLLLTVCLLSATAQHTIESIRKTYQEVHENMRMMSTDFPGEGIPMKRYHLEVNHNLPGTGPHMENIYMYYGELEDEDEDNPRIYPRHFLQFVTAKYNFAAHEYYDEYLYDENGEVMFIYLRITDVDVGQYFEYRIYLDGDHLLRLNVKETENLKEDFDNIPATAFHELYDGTKLSKEYREQILWSKEKAKKFLSMFKEFEDATYPYDE